MPGLQVGVRVVAFFISFISIDPVSRGRFVDLMVLTPMCQLSDLIKTVCHVQSVEFTTGGLLKYLKLGEKKQIPLSELEKR